MLINSANSEKILRCRNFDAVIKLLQERSLNLIAHVFVDAENIPPSVTFKVVEHFGKEHTITRVDIIAKEDALPGKYRGLDEKIFRVQNCFYGKNSADTWLCFEMVRAIIDEPELELIIIVSSDKDFLPAIKFAADFEKKILIVSNGAGHKTLTEQLKILGVEKESVELKDFRVNFGASEKLEKILPQLSFMTKKFLFEREEQIKFILVKRDEKFFEIPFVPGMSTQMFAGILRELNIFFDGRAVKNFAAENFLRVSRNKIFFQNEAELSEPTPAEEIEKFFSEHAAQVKKIFVKQNSRLHEIPFADGMPLELFGKLLREKKIIGKGASPAQIAAKSLLKIRDEKVFLCNDEEQRAAFGDTIKNVDEFFSFRAADVKNIFLKHANKIFEVPFVNGISAELFGKLLRERNIIGKSASVTSIAKKNLLDVRDGKIFLCDEDRRAELYAEAAGDTTAYFDRHDAKNIFVKFNGKLFEIPFVNGMPLKLFGKILREKKIIGRNSSAVKVAAQSLLDVRDERVFFIPEEELAAAQDDLEVNVDEFFNEHALQIKSISIRCGGKIFDLPFVEGMPLKIFGKLLRERKIIDRKISAEKIVAENKLELRGEKIFLEED